MQPDLHREGYGIFVRCCDLSPEIPASKFGFIIDTLDAILLDQSESDGFYLNPYGGALYRRHIDQALEAVRALVDILSASGVPAAIGVAWGRFQRTTNVHDWNVAAHPLNEAARLASCDEAKGRALVSPHVRSNAGTRVGFSDRRVCRVKGADYRYHLIESAGYSQNLMATAVGVTPATYDANIVLWDVVKYSTQHLDRQAELSDQLAVIATTALHVFGARSEQYSPTGDGGFAVFESGLQAIGFAAKILESAKSKGIAIRIGINHGEVASAKRGPVGPGVLRADQISARARKNGIAILADVWHNLDPTVRDAWRATEIEPGILGLRTAGASPTRLTMALLILTLSIAVATVVALYWRAERFRPEDSFNPVGTSHGGPPAQDRDSSATTESQKNNFPRVDAVPHQRSTAVPSFRDRTSTTRPFQVAGPTLESARNCIQEKYGTVARVNLEGDPLYSVKPGAENDAWNETTAWSSNPGGFEGTLARQFADLTVQRTAGATLEESAMVIYQLQSGHWNCVDVRIKK